MGKLQKYNDATAVEEALDKGASAHEALGDHTVKSDVPEGAKFTDTVYDDTKIKADIQQNKTDILSVNEKVEDLKAQGVQQTPLFAESVEWLEKNGDTSKVYVLPDGYLYAYVKSDKPTYTNQIAISTNKEGNVVGLLEGYRYNSSDNLVSQVGCCATGFIPVKKGDIIRLKGVQFRNESINAVTPGSYYLRGYNSNFELSGYSASSAMVPFKEAVTPYWKNPTYDNEGDLKSFEIGYDPVVYIRIAFVKEDNVEAIITVNEDIVENTSGYAWNNTGHSFVPADYEDRIIVLEKTSNLHAKEIDSLNGKIDNLGFDVIPLPSYWDDPDDTDNPNYLTKKIAKIKEHQETGGKDCFSFPLLTDIHISANLGKRSGLIAKRIIDDCNIKYAICCGDIMTRGANKTLQLTEASYDDAEELLKPIRSHLLQTQGNHDGSWGAEDLDNDGDIEDNEFYCYNYTPEKNHERIYRKVSLVGDCHFDSTGSGYWIDDVSNKVRYIGLNSHCNKYKEDADGTAIYNNMRIFRLTQSQFDLVIEALKTIPANDWAVLSFSHAPLNDRDGSTFGDRVLMREMLSAYKNKTTYSGTYAGTAEADDDVHGYDYVSVDVDFSASKGEYIAHFSGHTHTDTDTDFGIKVITTRCDAKEENTEDLKSERIAGTITEQSFDVFTINKKIRKIYATKIGAGSDREISY